MAQGEMVFNGADYWSRYIGSDTSTYSHFGRTGRCAVFEPGATPNYDDYRIATDSVLSIELVPCTDSVLGFACDSLYLQGLGFRTRYWMSQDLWLNPASYALHNAHNWKANAEATKGGLIIRSEHDFRPCRSKG